MYLECEDDAGPLVSKYRSLHLLNEDDSKDDDGVIRKVGNKWKILKKNRKDYWDADYKTKKDAENALKAYWANKHECMKRSHRKLKLEGFSNNDVERVTP